MKVSDRGHRYELDQQTPNNGGRALTKQSIQFLNTEKGRECEGVTTQEVIRALIDRTWYCNDCLPWSGNEHIVNHLRMALMLHEARARIRGVEKGELRPEQCSVGYDGHFIVVEADPSRASDYARMPENPTETGSLNPGVCRHQANVVDIQSTHAGEAFGPSGAEESMTVRQFPPPLRRGLE